MEGVSKMRLEVDDALSTEWLEAAIQDQIIAEHFQKAVKRIHLASRNQNGYRGTTARDLRERKKEMR